MLFIIAGSVLLADQASKAGIRHSMPIGESIPLIPGILHLTHVKNYGAAFGILQNQQIIFLLVSVAIILSILFYYWRAGKGDRLVTVSLGLVLGGAVGNFIDRAISQRVTDFIDLRFWPVFNLADSAIVVGVILLSIVLLSGMQQERAEKK